MIMHPRNNFGSHLGPYKPGAGGIPIGSIVVPFCGLDLGSYKVIPKMEPMGSRVLTLWVGRFVGVLVEG